MMNKFCRLYLLCHLLRWRPPAGIDCTVTFNPTTGLVGAVLESTAGSLSDVEFDLAKPIGKQMARLDRECWELAAHDRVAVGLKGAAREFEASLFGGHA